MKCSDEEWFTHGCKVSREKDSPKSSSMEIAMDHMDLCHCVMN